MTKPAASQSMLWGAPVEFWDAWGLRLMLAGAGLGVLALIASLASSFILYKVAAITQSDADKRIAEAGATAAKANADAAKANEAAANARLEHERLRQQVAWRQISDQAARRIADALRVAGLRPTILVTANDQEAVNLREHVLAVLRIAGEANPRWAASIIGQPFRGLAAQGPDEQGRRALIAAFAAGGIALQDGGAFEQLRIVIGAKPPPQ